MAEFIANLANLAVLVFVVACMVAAGLGLSVGDVLATFRRIRLMTGAILANFVVAPAVAFALTQLVPLDRSHAIGLLLLGAAAGAPFLPKLAERAKGDAAFSVGLMLLLMLGSVVFMPLVLPNLIPGLSAAPWPILRPLLFTMLFPIAIGMFIKHCSDRWATKLRAVVTLMSNVSMILVVLLLISCHFEAMIGTIGSGAIAVALAFVTISLLSGYALGGPAARTRAVLGLGTGQRNIAAALLIATQNFPANPDVVVMLVVSTFAGLGVLLVGAKCFARSAMSIPPVPGELATSPAMSISGSSK